LPNSRYDRPASRAFFNRMLERVRAVPGVRAATFIICVPFADRCRHTSSLASRDGIEIPPDQDARVGVNIVAPGYFAALGVPVSYGHAFLPADREDSRRVVVISRAAAERFWPGERPVGRSLSIRYYGNATVVGVAEDVRYDNVETLSLPDVYIPMSQYAVREGYVVTRHSAAPDVHIAEIRDVVRGLDGDVPLFDIRSMSDRVEDATWRTRFSSVLVSMFAAMTLVLSAIGIYGLLSYSVERRARDIGIMMALGATQKIALKTVVGSALYCAAGGIGLGIIVAITLTRFLQAMLFETSPHDLLTYSVVALMLVAVSLAASYFPARRASTVDPVEVLKAE
jgi:putative ABC transport system permease protein